MLTLIVAYMYQCAYMFKHVCIQHDSTIHMCACVCVKLNASGSVGSPEIHTDSFPVNRNCWVFKLKKSLSTIGVIIVHSWEWMTIWSPSTIARSLMINKRFSHQHVEGGPATVAGSRCWSMLHKMRCDSTPRNYGSYFFGCVRRYPLQSLTSVGCIPCSCPSIKVTGVQELLAPASQ